MDLAIPPNDQAAEIAWLENTVAALPSPTEATTIPAAQTEIPTDVNKEKAERARVVGNRCFAESHYREALTHYEEGLTKDWTSHLLWSNRIATLLKLNRPQDALRDSLLLIRLRPDWVRSHQRAADAAEALRMWEGKQLCLGVAVRIQPDDADLTRRYHEACMEATYMPLTGDGPVRVRFADTETTKARSLVATRRLAPGTIAFAEPPVLLCPNLPERGCAHPAPRCCAHCLRALDSYQELFAKPLADGAFTPEEACFTTLWPKLAVPPQDAIRCECGEVYCCLECKQVATKQYHHHLCPRRNPHVQPLLDLVARLSSGAAAEAEQTAEPGLWVSQNISPMMVARLLAMTMDPLGRERISNFVASERKEPQEAWDLRCPALFDAVRQALPGVTGARFHRAVSVILLNGTGVNTQGAFMQFSRELMATSTFFDQERIKAAKLIADLAKDQLLASGAPTRSPKGTALFLLQACLNHSCAPNTLLISGQHEALIAVKILRPVAPGEELTASYIDEALPNQMRQAALMQRYHFRCTCERCTQEEATGMEIPAPHRHDHDGCGCGHDHHHHEHEADSAEEAGCTCGHDHHHHHHEEAAAAKVEELPAKAPAGGRRRRR